MQRKENKVQIDYTNWKGERRERLITPRQGGIFWGSNEWHKEPQWLLRAFCHEKKAERVFAVKDIHSWRPQGDRTPSNNEPPLRKLQRLSLMCAISGMFELRDVDLAHSIVSEKRTLSDWIDCAIEELTELGRSIEEGLSSDEICDEFGDVLGNIVTIAILLGKENPSFARRAFLKHEAKLKHRKPHIFWENKHAIPIPQSWEEETALYQERKAQEKRRSAH